MKTTENCLSYCLQHSVLAYMEALTLECNKTFKKNKAFESHDMI